MADDSGYTAVSDDGILPSPTVVAVTEEPFFHSSVTTGGDAPPLPPTSSFYFASDSFLTSLDTLAARAVASPVRAVALATSIAAATSVLIAFLTPWVSWAQQSADESFAGSVWLLSARTCVALREGRSSLVSARTCAAIELTDVATALEYFRVGGGGAFAALFLAAPLALALVLYARVDFEHSELYSSGAVKSRWLQVAFAAIAVILEFSAAVSYSGSVRRNYNASDFAAVLGAGATAPVGWIWGAGYGAACVALSLHALYAAILLSSYGGSHAAFFERVCGCVRRGGGDADSEDDPWADAPAPDARGVRDAGADGDLGAAAAGATKTDSLFGEFRGSEADADYLKSPPVVSARSVPFKKVVVPAPGSKPALPARELALEAAGDE